jgi:plastocyanin
VPKRATFTIAMAAQLLLTAPAPAGVVRGVLRGPAQEVQEATPGAYAGHAASLAKPTPLVRNALSDAVIWLESIPAGADSAVRRPALPRLVQKGQAFAPRVLPIASGATVEFPNQDLIYHNVFSVSPTKRFDLGKYPRGHSRRVKFTRAGLVQVYCDIHANMAAFILVLPHGVFTQPDASGAFALPAVPAGPYKLRMWHPDLPEIRRPVDVPASGTVTVELNASAS